MSAAWLGKNNPFYGKTHSEETKALIGTASRAANLGRKFSEEHCAKLSAALLGKHFNCIKIEVLDLETNITTTYDSILQTAKALNCKHGSIWHNLQYKTKKPFKKRYIIRKID